MKNIVFVDTEVSFEEKKVVDSGAFKYGSFALHSSSPIEFNKFIENSDYICGHNIIKHDIPYLEQWLNKRIDLIPIDTLYFSPLLFASKAYHRLVKDDILDPGQNNNPLNDAQKAAELFNDEFNAFIALPDSLKNIYFLLLHKNPEFSGFFDFLDFNVSSEDSLEQIIFDEFEGLFCRSVDLKTIIESRNVELAYCLALLKAEDKSSLTPKWVEMNYPHIVDVRKALRGTPCNNPDCEYCREKLNPTAALKKYFNYESFRTYNGDALQEKAARAALEGRSLLAVFPTGGGKSITFQIPAIIAGESERGLTVVISPLQSLMKDQVDNLIKKNINNAVYINGLLNPIERKDAIERVQNGQASILYISPESLRSRTIQRLLMSRNVVRFVIDEAHCFSAWGQDFRIDYLFIADFIKKLQEAKHLSKSIPVSCFTATAKQKVISDICEYFRENLGLNLDLFTTKSDRKNLHYEVLFRENDDKYDTLRNFIQEKKCPTIVYVSRTAKTKELAERLCKDGFPALPFNGKMESEEKIKNQEAFMKGDVNTIVATSAFGMGVDKDNVKLVIHYEISDSLENYVQEAGRAGRDQNLQAECVVLFNNEDLDKHFQLLNSSKLSFSEIQEVWRAIKRLSDNRPRFSCSAYEIATKAGWNNDRDNTTRVRAAIAALEKAGYIKREMNAPHVYATSIQATNMAEASSRIQRSNLFTTDEKKVVSDIVSTLISERSQKKSKMDESESFIDVLADNKGLELKQVISIITKLKVDGLLADENDMSAFILNTDNENKINNKVKRFSELEFFLLNNLTEDGFKSDIKELNEAADNAKVKSTINNINTILYFLEIKKYISRKEESNGYLKLVPAISIQQIKERFVRRIDICKYIVDALFKKIDPNRRNDKEIPVQFSVVSLFKGYASKETGHLGMAPVTIPDIEEALLYLSKIGALRIEDGFLVLYNAMQISRIETNNAIQYKKEDYKSLQEYYTQKAQQIHIVGKYARIMQSSYEEALQFVNDYFMMDYRVFINKYFDAKEQLDIQRNITGEKYNKLFDKLSDRQKQIIDDDKSQYIVVAAGPGSGKTMLLVHKLASLILLEDVKHDQLLMLTFSRAAASEFKSRLYDLIGFGAQFVEIKTFHSYCFDLLGKIGKLEGAENVIKEATEFIKSEEAEPGKIIKKVLVIDEAQDMDADQFALVEAIIHSNENLRIIAVGDDDQNIYAFRGSDSKYMQAFLKKDGSNFYEMTENYRSNSLIVEMANAFAQSITQRMKNNPITAVSNPDGCVQLIYHSGINMIESLVNHVVHKYDSNKLISVLTDTNDQALQALGLLQKRNIPAKLIQSIDGFRLTNLEEIRAFTKYIDERLSSPIIDKNLWIEAKEYLDKTFINSTILLSIYNILDCFEREYPSLFRTDLEIFLTESKFEDFTEAGRGTVLVSTIHKSKGREFDKVFMLLDKVSVADDEDKRKIYVGLTRAKTELYVHFNSDVFNGVDIPKNVKKFLDDRNYNEPSEVMLQLGHKEVHLGSFKDNQYFIQQIFAGTKLSISNGFINAKVDGIKRKIGRLSNAAINTLAHLEARGYKVFDAEVRFLVWWKGEEDKQETLIVLPNIYLRK